MSYITPVYDRTATDISNQTAKAFINVVDWVRIYNNSQVVKILVDFLLSINVTFDSIGTPTVTAIPTIAQLNSLVANIERIRVASGLPAISGLVEIKDDWLEGPAADSPDYLDVNDWERVLDIIFSTMALSADYWIYCGVAAVGQPRFWQNRFRRFAWVPDAVSPVRLARTGIAISAAGLKRNNSWRRY